MANFTAKAEHGVFVVYSGSNIFGRIVFDDDNISASLYADSEIYRAEPESKTEKDIVVKNSGATLFKLKFDYLLGGADLLINGEDTGFEITGKLFKPGTRFVDADNNDLIIATGVSPEIKITVNDNESTPLMIITTLYYHLYVSASKTRTVIMNSIL